MTKGFFVKGRSTKYRFICLDCDKKQRWTANWDAADSAEREHKVENPKHKTDIEIHQSFFASNSENEKE